jgi:hypothetical protein
MVYEQNGDALPPQLQQPILHGDPSVAGNLTARRAQR